MSDREGRGPPNDDELSLPRATVAKMIQGAGSSSSDVFISSPFPLHPPIRYTAARGVLHEIILNSLSYLRNRVADCSELLPEDVTCAKDTRDLVIECCVGKTKILNIPVALILTSLF